MEKSETTLTSDEKDGSHLCFTISPSDYSLYMALAEHLMEDKGVRELLHHAAIHIGCGHAEGPLGVLLHCTGGRMRVSAEQGGRFSQLGSLLPMPEHDHWFAAPAGANELYRAEMRRQAEALLLRMRERQTAPALEVEF